MQAKPKSYVLWPNRMTTIEMTHRLLTISRSAPSLPHGFIASHPDVFAPRQKTTPRAVNEPSRSPVTRLLSLVDPWAVLYRRCQYLWFPSQSVPSVADIAAHARPWTHAWCAVELRHLAAGHDGILHRNKREHLNSVIWSTRCCRFVVLVWLSQRLE